MSRRAHVDDLRGASRLVVEATRSVVDLVRAMHDRIGSGPDLLGRPLERPTRLLNGIVYGPKPGALVLVDHVRRSLRA